MKTLLGCLLIAAPFAVLTRAMVRESGWRVALTVLGKASLIGLALLAGLWLVAG